MNAAIQILGWVLFLLSLPVVLELALFLFANLFLRRRGKEKKPGNPVRIEGIAVLVPAHDEEKNIQRCVESLLASDAGPFRRDVIVIADNCSDGTAERARAAGARVIERQDDKKRGKGAAIQYAVSKLIQEPYQAFIIVDADTVVEPGFIKTMGENFSAGKEALQCVYLPRNEAESPKIRLMRLALLSMNVLKPMGREILGFSVGILGNGFGLIRNLLLEVPYTANSITEDLEYHLKLIESGRRVRFVPDTRVLADFPLSSEGTETQRARWEGGRFLLQRTFSFPLLFKVLQGRLSFLEPLLELLSLPLSYEVLVLLALGFIPGQAFLFYALAGLAVIFLQILAAVALYGEKRDFLAFLQVPGYILWKLYKLPLILKSSRKGARWVRTKRE